MANPKGSIEKGTSLAEKEKELMSMVAADKQSKEDKQAGVVNFDSQNVQTDMAAFPITLPSKGVLYDGKLPDGKILIRPLTTNEERILFAPFGDGVQKIGSMINNCVVSKEINPDELLLIDRFYILLSLRIDAFGRAYKINVKCDSCGAQFKHDLDLINDLEVNEMDEDLVEPIDVTLPVSGDTVSLRLLRGADELKIAKHSKRIRMQSSDPSDPSFTYRQALQIVKLNGEEVAVNKLDKYVRKMHAKDSAAMRLALEEIEGGVDTRIYVDCHTCGYINEKSLPLDLEFFRPSSL